MREQILKTARELTLQYGQVPSLNAVVAATGISKGGLMHHFSTRIALVAGLTRQTIAEVDEVVTSAAAHGTAARAWLDLSLPDAGERRLLQALSVELRPDEPGFHTVLAEARTAITRWEGLIADETGDPVRARVIRLVGDALVANAVMGLPSSPEDVEELVDFLIATPSSPAPDA